MKRGGIKFGLFVLLLLSLSLAFYLGTGKSLIKWLGVNPDRRYNRGEPGFGQPWGSKPAPKRVAPRDAGPPPAGLSENAERVFIREARVPAQPVLPERDVFGVRLVPEYAGAPFSQCASAMVQVNLWDYQNSKWSNLQFPSASEAFFIPGLVPGTFSCNLKCDAEPGNPPDFPGDYFATAFFFRDKSQSEPVVVPMKRFLHVIEPADNSAVLSSGRTATGAAKVAWEAVPGADEYQVEFGVQPHGWPKTEFATTGTSLVATLTPDQYKLSVKGIKGKQPIAGSLFHFSTPYVLQDGTEKIINHSSDLSVTIKPQATQPMDVSLTFWQAGAGFVASSGMKAEVTVTRKFFSSPLENPVEMSPGSFTIRQLPPGAYEVKVWIDANSDNPVGFPGDYFGSGHFYVPPTQSYGPGVYLYKIMRLKFPDDSNDPDLADRLEAGGFSKSHPPVTFAWDSLGEGVKYNYYFNPGTSGTTTATSLLIDLPMGQVSNFRLSAYSSRGEVGKLIIGGKKNREVYPFMVENLPEDPAGNPGLKK